MLKFHSGSKTSKNRTIWVSVHFNLFVSIFFKIFQFSTKEKKSYRGPKFDGDAKQTLEIRVERKRNLKLGELGEVSFEMLKLGEFGKVSFGIYKLGEYS